MSQLLSHCSESHKHEGTHTWSHLVTSSRSGRWTLLQARAPTNTGAGGGKDRVDPRSEQLSAGPHDPGWPGLQVDETERQNTKSAQMSTNWETPCSKIHKDRCARQCISCRSLSFHDVSQPVDRWWQGANIQDSSSNSPLRPLDFVLQFLVPLLLFCFP